MTIEAADARRKVEAFPKFESTESDTSADSDVAKSSLVIEETVAANEIPRDQGSKLARPMSTCSDHQ